MAAVWDATDLEILDREYPAGGSAAVQRALLRAGRPLRNLSAIGVKASACGLRATRAESRGARRVRLADDPPCIALRKRIFNALDDIVRGCDALRELGDEIGRMTRLADPPRMIGEPLPDEIARGCRRIRAGHLREKIRTKSAPEIQCQSPPQRVRAGEEEEG